MAQGTRNLRDGPDARDETLRFWNVLPSLKFLPVQFCLRLMDIPKKVLIMCFMIVEKRYYGDSVVEVDEARRFKEIADKTFVLMDTTNVPNYLLAYLGSHRVIYIQPGRITFRQIEASGKGGKVENSYVKTC
nr:isoflavone 3'-hydroxylase-like [Tanacetum cinerariifolium]